DEEIGVFFISPCPAKVSYVKNPIGVEKSAIDGSLAMSDVYFRLVPVMNKITTPISLSKTGLIGISWAGSGGEASALFNDKYLAADGMENVINVLEEIDNGNISGLQFVELNACSGGCVGGALTVVNPYISKARLQSLRRYLPVSQNRVGSALKPDSTEIPSDYLWNIPLKYTPILQLDADMAAAMRKMSEIQHLRDQFPDLDCGACGAPTCLALAEDIACGDARENDCIMKWKDVLRSKDLRTVAPEGEEPK
ncbi:MAG: ferredoxin, partial [Clostridia bacterium]|nr:ferredoxin [Clostridia bacterium]